MVKLICHIREARSKARAAASEELLCVFHGLGGEASQSGPLAEKGGVLWIDLPDGAVDEAESRCARLGYTRAVDIAEPATGRRGTRPTVRYRRRDWSLRRLYQEDEAALRAEAPDQREFLLTRPDGTTHLASGYRGTGAPGQRRALPACDARLLANLASPALGGGGRLLDPFAGAGSIVQHAVGLGVAVSSADIDPAMAGGLRRLGSRHLIADARALPLGDGAIGGIATEPPYDEAFGAAVTGALDELARVLAPGGRLAMLCARWQADELSRRGDEMGLISRLALEIDRKGSDCSLLVWVA
jgi:SAM-dependent methyltransferase